MLLAIESSCDESAAALFDINAYLNGECSLLGSLVTHKISSQITLHQEYGGVVPELAAREHVGNIPFMVEQVLEEAARNRGISASLSDSLSEVSLIAVTQGPGLKGCLLAGITYAKGLALQRNIPLIPVNHLEGHVLSALLCSDIDCPEDELFPAICVLVSGGHTQVLWCHKPGSYVCLATTMDDAAGEAFDKVGTLMGLPYPAGATVSRLAKTAKSKDLVLPIAVPKDLSHFSFSGLKTAASRLIQAERENIERDPERLADIAYALEVAIVEALCRKLRKLMSEESVLKYGKAKSLFLAGGVAANERLRTSLREIAEKSQMHFLVPGMEFCTDNAAMIGAAASIKIKNSAVKSATSNLAFSAEPRFPLTEVL